jgi:hypothetical protein
VDVHNPRLLAQGSDAIDPACCNHWRMLVAIAENGLEVVRRRICTCGRRS